MSKQPHIDNPTSNDNREYAYSGLEDTSRPEYEIIASWVPRGATIIDLGCGDGTLLQILRDRNDNRGTGVERSPTGVQRARARGLDAVEGLIDRPLTQFADNAFDIAVCNATIHMVMYPEVLLAEMKRLAAVQIISFPNFGFYRNRLDLLFRGRVPRPHLFGYTWYTTGHIHPLSITDFHQLVKDVGGLRVTRHSPGESTTGLRKMLGGWFPNLFEVLSVFRLERIP